jgi:ribosomal protein L7/L12
MIGLNLTVREALELARGCNEQIFEQIVRGVEQALKENRGCTVTITGGVTTDYRIECIKAVRVATNMGLRESMDWVDVVRDGKSNTISLKDAATAQQLLNELVALGCQGHLS